MDRYKTRYPRTSVLLLLALFTVVLFIGCGGGGGGTSGTSPGNQSTPSSAVSRFSTALKNNDETAATANFAEGTKDKNIRIWRSLSANEKIFIARAIEDSVTVPSVGDNQTRLDLFVKVKDASGEVERIPLVLVKDINGKWKIMAW